MKKYGEGITYTILEKGCKMLFMPHSPGIYVALMLNDLCEEDSKDRDRKQMTGKKPSLNVVKKKLNNYIFLDLQSLPEKLQTILVYEIMLGHG